MAKALSPADRAIAIVRRTGIARARDLAAQGVARAHLSRLVKEGRLVRGGRGIYFLPDADLTEFHSYAEACKRVPHGVICLLSALVFHGLTTQKPKEVWMMLRRGTRKPRVDYPPVRLHFASGQAFSKGVEKHTIEGVQVRVTCVAKTIVDLFRYRNKVGIDIAVEALRDAYRGKRFTMDELWQYMKVARMTNVMRDYLEMLE